MKTDQIQKTFSLHAEWIADPKRGERANFSGADLRNADLYGASLTGASFRKANLYGAKLTGANLTGADFFGANLRKADLAGAALA